MLRMKYFQHFIISLTLVLGLLVGAFSCLQAQDTTLTDTMITLEDLATPPLPPTEEGEVEDFSRVDPPQNFGLIFGRSIMITGGLPDSVPISGGASGAYFLGAGYRFYIGKAYRFGLRFSPGIAWNRYTYDQTSAKTFPTTIDSTITLSRERHSMVEVKAELGVFINITRDEDYDPLIFVEVGGYGGYMTAFNYIRRFTDGNNLRVREKYRDLEKLTMTDGANNTVNTFNRLQYGFYGRLGYKWAALYVGYRLSDVLNDPINDALLFRDQPNFQAVTMPPIDIGFHIMF